MSEMKDSGVEWIGSIPRDWHTFRIKDVADIIMGQSPESNIVSNCGQTPFMQGNAEFGVEYPESIKFCDSPPKKSRIGDILMSVRAPVGELNISDKEYGIGRGLCSIMVTGIHHRFLWYFLKSSESYFDMIGNGSTFDAITVRALNNAPVVAPPIAFQKTISSVLDLKCSVINASIEKIQKQSELLEDYKKSIVAETITKGLDPNVPMKDSGVGWIRQIPVGWSIGKLSSMYEVILGKMLCGNPTGSEDTFENYLCAANVKWGGVGSETKKMWFTPGEKEQLLLEKGDVIVSEGGDVGTSCIYKGEYGPCFIQNAVFRLRAKGDWVNGFAYYWLYYAKTIGHIDLICNKATIAHFTKSKLSALPIIIASPEQQKSIVTFLDSRCAVVDHSIKKIQRYIELLEEYKKSVIFEYVTGKKQVEVEA